MRQMRAIDLTPPAAAPLGTIRALVAMARPSQIALIVLVYLMGALLGAWRGVPAALERERRGRGLAGPGAAVPAAVATHWANEAADAETDARSVRTPFSGGSGALLRPAWCPALPCTLSLLTAGGVALVAGVAGVSGALPGPGHVVLLLVGLAGGLAYSLPPVAAMRRGWGEVLNALLGALALPLYGVAVVRGDVVALDVVAVLPFTSVTLCSVLATAWPDREADAATGKRTLQVRWPAARLRRLGWAATIGWLLATLAAATLEAAPAWRRPGWCCCRSCCWGPRGTPGGRHPGPRSPRWCSRP